MIFKGWKREEVISVVSVVVSVVVTIGVTVFGYFLGEEVKEVKLIVAPVVDLKPTIINNNNIITKVEKEVAGLIDVIKEREKLEVDETFLQADIGTRIKYIEKPEEFSDTTANYIIFKLKQIPIHYSVEIHAQNGPVPKGTFDTSRNIVKIQTLNPLRTFLDTNTEFFRVYCVPDTDSKEEMVQIDNLETSWDLENKTIEWNY